MACAWGPLNCAGFSNFHKQFTFLKCGIPDLSNGMKCACVQVSPSDTKVDEEYSLGHLAKERARLTAELADAKKKFMAVAKRKQQEYNKKVNRLPIRTVKPFVAGSATLGTDPVVGT